MNTSLTIEQLHHTTQHLLDILFPPQCAGCKKTGSILCLSCIHNIPLLKPPLCPRCGVPLSTTPCPGCRYLTPGLSGLRAVSTYEGPFHSYIHSLKYQGQTRLAEPLGKLLAQAYITYGMKADYVLPVPLHEKRQQQRGYNHACLLANMCARQLGLPLRNDLLVRQRATLAQVGLTAAQRHSNVFGAFAFTPTPATRTLSGRNILVIDDVCTTGATLAACAAHLFAFGAQSVWGLVLARHE